MKQETISAIASAIRLVLDEVCQPQEYYPRETSKDFLRRYYADRMLEQARLKAAEDFVFMAANGQTEITDELGCGVYFPLLKENQESRLDPEWDFGVMLTCAKGILADHAKKAKPEPKPEPNPDPTIPF